MLNHPATRVVLSGQPERLGNLFAICRTGLRVSPRGKARCRRCNSLTIASRVPRPGRAPGGLPINGPRINGPRISGPRISGLRISGLRISGRAFRGRRLSGQLLAKQTLNKTTVRFVERTRRIPCRDRVAFSPLRSSVMRASRWTTGSCSNRSTILAAMPCRWVRVDVTAVATAVVEFRWAVVTGWVVRAANAVTATRCAASTKIAIRCDRV